MKKTLLLCGLVLAAALPASWAHAVAPTATPTPMFGQVAPGKFWAWGGAGPILVASDAETVLTCGILPPGALLAGRVFRVLVEGAYSTTGTPNVTVGFRLVNGANSGQNSFLLAGANNANGKGWSYLCTITVLLTGSTGSINIAGQQYALGGSGTTVSDASITMQVSSFLQTRVEVTGQFSAASQDNSMYVSNAAFFPGQ